MKILFIIATLLLSQAQANDGMAAISAGGIKFEKSNDIVMKSEVLTISTNKITIKYEFLNESAKDITGIVAFPVPVITCGAWGSKKGIDDFTAVVDGKNITVEKELKAVEVDGSLKIGTRDLTEKVLKAKLPLDCRKLEVGTKEFKIAKKNKLADDYDLNDPAVVYYGTKITYHWKQVFPPKKIIQIEHSYTPLKGVAGGMERYIVDKNLNWDKDPEIKKEQYGYSSKHIGALDIVEYIVLTALTWKGPIGDFTLILKKDSEKHLIGSNLGPIKITGPTTAEFKAKNFVPNEDLYIAFGNPPLPHYGIKKKK